MVLLDELLSQSTFSIADMALVPLLAPVSRLVLSLTLSTQLPHGVMCPFNKYFFECLPRHQALNSCFILHPTSP